MLEFVKELSIEDKIRKRLYMDHSSFIEIDQYGPSAAFPSIFEKKEKFDCILADLGINRFLHIFYLYYFF